MIPSRQVFSTLALSAILLASAVPIAAQSKFPPDRFENLKVLPQTSSGADVIAAMKEFARGLGVRCQYCHVGKEGMPLEAFDFVSDSNARKDTARAMMRLVSTINAQLEKDAIGAGSARVTCFTCHRGAAHPVNGPEGARPGA